MLNVLANPFDERHLRRIWSLAFEPDLAVLDLARRLRVPSALLSNNGPILEDCLRHELSRAVSPFVATFLSWRLRARKPDPIAFSAVSAAVAVPPAQMLLIDDDERNIEVARRVGWQAEHFTGHDLLGESLFARGLV